MNEGFDPPVGIKDSSREHHFVHQIRVLFVKGLHQNTAEGQRNEMGFGNVFKL